MKKIKYLFVIIVVLILLVNVEAKGGVTLSKNSLTITKGKTDTFVVNGTNVAGVVKISSSDTSIASVDVSEYFFDTSLNQSKVTVKVTGKKEGTATINVVLSDIATFDEEDLSGTKTVSIKVVEPEVKNTTNNSSNNNTNNNSNNNKNASNDNSKQPDVKSINITRFEVVGYNIDFNAELYKYDLNVYEDVTKLYIVVEGENFTIEGNKEVDIKDKDEITVTLSNSSEKKEYKIKINRIGKNKDTDCLNTVESNKECKDKDYKVVLIVMTIFMVLSLVLLVIVGKNLKDKKKFM